MAYEVKNKFKDSEISENKVAALTQRQSYSAEINEEQGEGTESRYTPTRCCDITGSDNAKKIILKNINISIDCEDDENYNRKWPHDHRPQHRR